MTSIRSLLSCVLLAAVHSAPAPGAQRNGDCAYGETPYNGGCVVVRIEKRKYPEAKTACQTEGGNLVSIHTDAENDFYKNLVTTTTIYNEDVLIGLYYEDPHYNWVDGTRTNYTNFAYAFPNPRFGKCVELLAKSVDKVGEIGEWANTRCDIARPYICWKPVGPSSASNMEE